MNIHLHIENLALNGLVMTSAQRAAIQTAVETELAQILGAEGLAGMTSTNLRTVSGRQIQLANQAGPLQTGAQIGGAVYSALNSLRVVKGPTQQVSKGTR